MENYICNKGYKNTRYKDLQRSGDWVIQTSPPLPSPNPTHPPLRKEKQASKGVNRSLYAIFSHLLLGVHCSVLERERT